MIANLINTAYGHVQTAHRWYWSRNTQLRLAHIITETQDIIFTLVILLSHLYSDCVALLDTWLTNGIDAFVITEQCDDDMNWHYVAGLLWVDFTTMLVHIDFTLGDVRNAATEAYYRVRTVLS